jgi:hypothetical protein
MANDTSAPQVWDVPISPAQRVALISLAFAQDAASIKNLGEGQSLRRAVSAFGLNPIRNAFIANKNRTSRALGNDRSPRLHSITIENVRVALDRWAVVPRTVFGEMELGELFDVLERLKDQPSGWTAPEVPRWSAAEEDWAPEPDPEAEVAPPPKSPVVCPSCGQSFDLDETTLATEGPPAP